MSRAADTHAGTRNDGLVCARCAHTQELGDELGQRAESTGESAVELAADPPAASAEAALILAPFSTRLPPELIDRLRIAAPQLGLRQGQIAALAIDRFLHDHGH